jgi:AAA+ ATPase superfamily predicted ATPase
MDNEFNAYFPQGLALGENFCNREEERAQIAQNIKAARATLITSPRRYGKTSLLLYVLSELKHPFTHIDLFAELSEADIQNAVLSGIGDVISNLETKTQKAFKAVTDFFSEFNVNFKYVGSKLQVEFSKTRKQPAKVILEALMKLDDFLKRKHIKAILFFDEFQRISQITESISIEAAIRQVAQESKNICFIFSGSNRNLLSSLFDDQKKPLYKLCDRITLERIKEEAYMPFIKKKFQSKGKKNISEEAIHTILDITECHPYYVNVLCHKILSKNITSIASKEVEEIWHYYATAERSNITNEIDLLSANQSKMLIAMAKYGDEFSPSSKEFLSLTKFSNSSALQSLKTLIKRDYIQGNEHGKFTIVDPLIKYIFHGNLPKN